MGKIETSGNHPTNSSLSYTLDHLRTFVQITELAVARDIEAKDTETDQWCPLQGPEFHSFELSAHGQQRFLAHFQKMKTIWGIQKNFLLESANNFPADCGLASSASSFAALTLTAAKLFQQINPQPRGDDLKYLSELSRMGSGSSCRSLFAPWALWQAEYAEPLKLEYTHLHHFVVVVEDSKKEVSSSAAHKLVMTSPRFEGRIERAELRLKDLIQALRFKDWPLAVQITWDEFIDMHRLFETSTPAFGYMTDASKAVIAEAKAHFDKWHDGPLVTMDAGANVHFLFRSDQETQFHKLAAHHSQKFTVIKSPTVEGPH